MTNLPAAAVVPPAQASPGEHPTDALAIVGSYDSPEGFAVIFDRHFDAIHGYLARRVGVDLADDLASETFVCAFRARASYDPARSDARPWLYQIATNLVRSHWRAEQRRLSDLATRHVEEAPLGDPEAIVEAAAVAAAMPALAEALAGLTPDQREPLYLYAWAGLSYEQIAEALELPVGTVRSRLSRARATLWSRLRQHLDPEATRPDATPKEQKR
ncbi:MAG: RNA polymerase sigma factor [Acidimicrobiales bacterium]